MKKIDIEKWERKVPNLPEDFFDKMQEKVLAETTQRKEPRRFSLMVVWSSVAAVLVFGLMFFLNNNQNEVKNNILVEGKKTKNIEQEPTVDVEQKLVIEPIISENLLGVKAEFVSQKISRTKEIKPEKRVDNDDLDNMFNEMTESEIQDLAMNYEQDAYLELY